MEYNDNSDEIVLVEEFFDADEDENFTIIETVATTQFGHIYSAIHIRTNTETHPLFKDISTADYSDQIYGIISR